MDAPCSCGLHARCRVLDRERMEERTQQVLKRLPEMYGLALLWRYWENRSVRDMAEATGKLSNVHVLADHEGLPRVLVADRI